MDSQQVAFVIGVIAELVDSNSVGQSPKIHERIRPWRVCVGESIGIYG